VLVQVVESALIVCEDLGSSPKYVNYVYFVIKVFIICWATLRNMGWPDGLELILLWHGVGSNLGGLKFNFFLLKGCVAEYE